MINPLLKHPRHSIFPPLFLREVCSQQVGRQRRRMSGQRSCGRETPALISIHTHGHTHASTHTHTHTHTNAHIQTPTHAGGVAPCTVLLPDGSSLITPLQSQWAGGFGGRAGQQAVHPSAALVRLSKTEWCTCLRSRFNSKALSHSGGFAGTAGTTAAGRPRLWCVCSTVIRSLWRQQSGDKMMRVQSLCTCPGAVF